MLLAVGGVLYSVAFYDLQHRTAKGRSGRALAGESGPQGRTS
jgi:hypothetical protein